MGPGAGLKLEHQHGLVDTLVRSGRYQNASEVLREGLRPLEQRERRETGSHRILLRMLGR